MVVVAAGTGSRAGGEVAKQFREIAGIPMLLRALKPFLDHPTVLIVVAVVPPSVASNPPRWLGTTGDRLRVVAGGAERVDSVALGLEALDDRIGVVVVHDGARPFVARATIDQVIATARMGAGGVAGIPVTDTVKRVEGGDQLGPLVKATVSRDGLWRAQTPQAFPIRLLREGLVLARAERLNPTDDAAMVEAVGGRVVMVPDRPTNIKVTTADDFLLAEAIARRR